MNMNPLIPSIRAIQRKGYDVRIKSWRTRFGRPALVHALSPEAGEWTERYSARGETVGQALANLVKIVP